MRETPPPAAVSDEDYPEPPRLRALRRLTTALSATLIVGVLVVAGALVIRITSETARGPSLAPADIAAESLTLPAGRQITATGFGDGALLIVTRGGEGEKGEERLHVFDAKSGAPLKELAIERAPEPSD